MNLLITGAWQDAPLLIPQLRAEGHQVVFMQNETDELPCEPEWVEGVICNGLFLSHEIDLFTCLKYIQLTSAGLDRAPLDVIRARGIILRNARGVYSIPMAEHALCAALSLYRKMQVFSENQSNRLWQKQRDLRELFGKTVVIIGCGSVGEECAKRFRAFGCEIIGVDEDDADRAYCAKVYRTDRLHEAIASADIVLLTLPLTPQTEGMADHAFFRSLKDGCVLINIARGGLVRGDALIQALRERTLYAALDVFDEEPLAQSSPLWTMENVLITPHNSFVGEGNRQRLNDVILHNLSGVTYA